MNNNLIVIGRITKDLELRTTESGKHIVRVSIAIKNSKDDTTFLDIDCFGNIADNINKYLNKGDLIGFEAKVVNNNWTDKDGKKHYDYRFIAKNSYFLSKSNASENNKEEIKKESLNKTQNSEKDAYELFAEETEITEDDLPF